ncbi:MAG: nitrogenase component 1 [Methanomethylophilus sp.]
MYKIAVYGKGGVGKSLLAANLSYLLSRRGLKVLHVGCDPKHDSTRLLTGGVSQSTFLDALTEHREDGVVQDGINGVRCVECGGAEPGIGCAGKGMLAMFTYVEQHTPADTDLRICDVLGDVVCGGFSVPMRRENVDGIMIVTSEEFMSIYAANNILRGLRNLNGTSCMLGLVLNSRNPEDEGRVREFARAVQIPILGRITRSPLFSQAEGFGRPEAEAFPDSAATRELTHLADQVQAAMTGQLRPVMPRPLGDKAMTEIAAGRPVTDPGMPAVRTACRFDAYDRERRVCYKGDFVMPACTSHGAVELLLAVSDAAIVLHGARNCAFLMEYAWRRRAALSAGGRSPAPTNLYSTEMDGRTTFGGDTAIIKAAVARAAGDGFREIFVVPTCTPETIGTDLPAVCAQINLSGVTVTPVAADPEFLSSKFGGYGGALQALAGLIDWSLPTVPHTVNLFMFEPNYLIRPENRRFIYGLLAAFGLKLNAIFIEKVTTDQIRQAGTAQYNLAISDHPLDLRIADVFLAGKRPCKVINARFGLAGEYEWIDALAVLTDQPERGMAVKQQVRDRYQAGLAEFRPQLAGKKVLFYTRSDSDLSWVVPILQDLDTDIVGIATWRDRITDLRPDRTGHPEIPRFREVELCGLPDVARRYGADLLLSSDLRVGRQGFRWTGLSTPYLGVTGALSWVRRMAAALKTPPQEGWRKVEI